MLATAIYTGLRQQEVIGPLWGDLDFDAQVVRCPVKSLGPPRARGLRVTLKTENAGREVPLSPELLAHLREYRASTLRKANADYVFSTASGGPVAWNNVDKSLKGIVARAGCGSRGRPSTI